MKTNRCLAAATLAVLALLAGCSAPTESAPMDSGGRAADAYPENGSADRVPAGAPSSVPSSAATPQVARTAKVSLTVADVEAAATRLRELATAKGGTIIEENLVSSSTGVGRRSTVVLSVPATNLDATLAELADVGSLTGRVVTSEDVTAQVADVDARIKTLDASIARLRELSKKAAGVSDLTALERELSNRVAERDSLAAQQRALAGRVAQSPITVTLRTPDAPAEEEPTGFMVGLTAGWSALVSFGTALVTAVGAVLPFAGVIAVIAVPVVLWRRRGLRAASRPGKGAPSPGVTTPVEPAQEAQTEQGQVDEQPDQVTLEEGDSGPTDEGEARD